MYSLIKTLSSTESIIQQVGTLTFSLVLAEVFYKFGSFTLEAVAFLGTWFLTDLLISKIRQSLNRS